MNLVEVKTAPQLKDFVLCASNFYANDPHFIPHLQQDIFAIFDSHKNSLLKTGAYKAWLLYSHSQKIIGRIAAFYDANQIKSTIGGIGFFECIDDTNAAGLLFSAAENWLKSNGFKGADGPINFGERDKYWGLLITPSAFPSYQENYNPLYYQKLFEQHQYQLHFQQLTSEISMESFKLERFQKLAQRVFQNTQYQFKHFQISQLKSFAQDFVTIYNQAWQHRPDFTPITLDRVLLTLESLKPILIEKGIWFAYAHQQPAGFYVAIPEVNQLFKHVNGNLNTWGKLKFLYHKYFGKQDRMRGIVFGIIPEYQNHGLETGLIMKFYEAMLQTTNYRKCELAWIGDFNPRMQSLIKALGAETSKIHYTYRKMFN